MPNHSIEDPFVIDKILSHLASSWVHRSQRLVALEHARRRQRFAHMFVTVKYWITLNISFSFIKSSE
jgi:hypothetical protein